jgi:cellulose 1,4-beta-cellobiosidase
MRTLRQRLAGTAAAVSLLALFSTMATAQAPACQVTYTKSWEGGNGFGANIVITNNGPAITNGWTLIFSFPNGQRLQNGWPVLFTQPAGSAQMTVASNADWNKAIGSGGSFTAGFNGTFSGANNSPTAFTLNGTACNGAPPVNPPPTVSLTSPASGAQFNQGASVTLAANATDNGAVTRVDFSIDGAVVASDTTSPYSFSTTTLAVGNHTAQATAFDNANPPLSAATAMIPFSVVAVIPMGNTIIANPTTVNIAGSATATATGTSNVRLSAAPPAAGVAVTLTRTGSTAITASPGTINFTTANWQAGVTVTFTAAVGATAATSTFALAGPNLTGTSITVNRTAPNTNPPPRADNPYAGATVYNNPQWRASAVAGGGSSIANQPTGVWFDRISAIAGNGSPTTGFMGLADHLNAAVTQDQQNGASALVFQMVVYNLPGRDCAALASNGELGPNDLPRYQNEYINPIRDILRRPEYANLRIVAIIEIDSLPNLVTNRTNRVTGTAACDTMFNNNGYVNGVGYALAQLGSIPNVYNYVDAGHHGWLGWTDNFGASVEMMRTAATASGSTLANVHGFITNTANTSALQEPFITVDATTRTSRWIDFNQFNDELTYAQAFRNQAVSAGFASNIGMLIDTSRNGWGGAARPTGPSTLADLNARIDASRVDRRIHKGNWCNPSGAGIGERPRAAPAAGIDAFVWIKPPGESDGSSSLIPNDEGKGFDAMCAPGNPMNPRNNNSATGALPNAPISGHWFQAQFDELMRNAFPPL